MFTGIIEAVGTVTGVADNGERSVLTIATPGWGQDLQYGESIAVNGVCLTVASADGDEWTADVMAITRSTTTLGGIEAGSQVNLERAMRADGRLGGHIMQGHVDATAVLVDRDSQADWDDFSFRIPSDLAKYVVAKGSIALNGTSLTVAGVVDDVVTVSLIPTTLKETTFGALEVGTSVNVEVDVIAKYVERLMGGRS